MSIAYDPILGHLQPSSSPSAEGGYRPWYSPPLGVSPPAEDADLFFGSPLSVNKNANILLGFYNQQQSIDNDAVFASSIECNRPRLSGDEASLLGNQPITTNHKHLDDFPFENTFNAVQLDWQDQFVDLRYDGLDDWTFSALPESSNPSGSCSHSQGSPLSTTPPIPIAQSGRETSPRHHSSSCSPPEDLAELVEVAADWAYEASLSPDRQSPVDRPALYKNQQQILDEIYRECEHQRSMPFDAHSQGLSTGTDMRSTSDAVPVLHVYPSPSLSSYDEQDEEECDEDAGSLEIRKKTQNRKAANRYRTKRKQQRRVIQCERERLERENRRLLGQVQDAQREVDYLKSFLSEIRQKVVAVAV